MSPYHGAKLSSFMSPHHSMTSSSGEFFTVTSAACCCNNHNKDSHPGQTDGYFSFLPSISSLLSLAFLSVGKQHHHDGTAFWHFKLPSIIFLFREGASNSTISGRQKLFFFLSYFFFLFLCALLPPSIFKFSSRSHKIFSLSFYQHSIAIDRLA